ncbi:MAG TPA: glycoside hydrolase family 16 protein, partial [Pyrinomonadaceae bacterium]|nr:glycoside hydrolase family 16 protein [Pyrinomonadaceae bacterium]
MISRQRVAAFTRARLILASVLSLMLLLSSSPLPPVSHAQTWTLVWGDEFDGASGAGVDATKWTAETGGGGWGNQELEYYTDATANAFADGNGSLVIKAIKATKEMPVRKFRCWYGQCRYTSARLITKNKFAQSYGRVEARIKIPYGQGIWPAFWMLGDNIDKAGWPTCGEIDIMENIGREPSIAHGTIHGPGYSGANGIGAPYTLTTGERFADAFHVFAIEWETNRIRWFVDSQLYFTVTPANLPNGTTWVFNAPEFLLMN